jgi:protease-4
MQKMMNDIYAQFTKKAAAGRKMDYDKLEKLARGRVYTGVQALAIGLVDELGTLDDAIAHAKKAAGIDPETKLERLSLPKPTSPFEALFGPLDPTTRLSTGIAKAWLDRLPGEISSQLKNLEVYDVLAREKFLTVMPYQLLIK